MFLALEAVVRARWQAAFLWAGAAGAFHVAKPADLIPELTESGRVEVTGELQPIAFDENGMLVN